jgi:hypothetical protein
MSTETSTVQVWWRNIAIRRKADEPSPARSMNIALIIGAIFTLVLAGPVILWLTKLIRPPKPEEEAIHCGIAETRRREARRREKMPYHRG